MKAQNLRYLASLMRRPAPQAAPPRPPPPPPQKKSRKQRRADAAFARAVTRGLAKKNLDLPVAVKMLPDGGIEVKVDARSEEKKERQEAQKEKVDGQ